MLLSILCYQKINAHWRNAWTLTLLLIRLGLRHLCSLVIAMKNQSRSQSYGKLTGEVSITSKSLTVYPRCIKELRARGQASKPTRGNLVRLNSITMNYKSKDYKLLSTLALFKSFIFNQILLKKTIKLPFYSSRIHEINAS